MKLRPRLVASNFHSLIASWLSSRGYRVSMGEIHRETPVGRNDHVLPGYRDLPEHSRCFRHVIQVYESRWRAHVRFLAAIHVGTIRPLR